MVTNTSLRLKLQSLDTILKDMHGIALAYSGGVDSSFLLARAKLILADNVIAITAATETFPEHELSFARKVAKSLFAKHIVTQIEDLKNDYFVKNDEIRCYYCKSYLFSHIIEIASQAGFQTVIDGSNLDDCQDYRPGLRALKELHIRSPLIEANMTKDDIRCLSNEMGLETWDKPSFACLASRIPYGTKITKARIDRIANAETFLKSLNLSQVRVRYHGSIARIEVVPDDFPLLLTHAEMVTTYLTQLGFAYVTMDLAGYKSGSMNKVLPL